MNILIVESQNDQYFVEALSNKLALNNQVCRIDEYKYSSLSEQKLTVQLEDILTNVCSRGVSKIGVILDIDNSNEKERIELINKCLQKSFNSLDYERPSLLLTKTNEFISTAIDGITLKIACFFTNVDGEGELETVLKAIKSQDSTFADCLYEGWCKCFQAKGKKIGSRNESCDISEKELLKLWVDFYKRFDTLKRKDRNEENTNWRGIMTGRIEKDKKIKNLASIRGEEIFDIEHEKLNDIKSFLKMFD